MWDRTQGKTRLAWLTTLACVSASLLCAFAADAFAADKESELKQLRARIESIRKGIEADAQRRDALANELKEADLAVQSARVKVAQVREQRVEAEERVAELKRQRAKTERSIATERESLAKELRAAYVGGREEQLTVLLNQQNPADLGRMMTYYGFFARARAERISAITDQLAHLDLLTEKMSAESERLRSIEDAQARETKELGQARTSRAQTLASVQSKIRSGNDQANVLERQAKALQKLIEEMEQAARDLPALPTQGFARTQGKLPWPLNGKVVANFGEPRAGGPLKWEGLVLAAAPGTQVRAVFHGRVVYADYLYGMGLMVMIDHGDGYSSIYGHNEQLFCKVGDKVAPGDVLGVLADQSGVQGSARGELHLEIRKGKQALDPRKWLRKP